MEYISFPVLEAKDIQTRFAHLQGKIFAYKKDGVRYVVAGILILPAEKTYVEMVAQLLSDARRKKQPVMSVLQEVLSEYRGTQYTLAAFCETVAKPKPAHLILPIQQIVDGGGMLQLGFDM